ncbi:hypothetical protein ANO14919_090960 [Xylariales sp. No.14919]|nr:hypothetical protein ANO14919_090960 [Xylariales sp. No.14919]
MRLALFAGPVFENVECPRETALQPKRNRRVAVSTSLVRAHGQFGKSVVGSKSGVESLQAAALVSSGRKESLMAGCMSVGADHRCGRVIQSSPPGRY